MKNIFLYLLAFCLLVVSCKKDDDKPANNSKYTTQEFVYGAMQEVYLWNDHIPTLDPNSYSEPANLFEAIRYKSNIYEQVDQWSFLTDDFIGVLNMFQGITTSFGHRLYLTLVEEGSPQVVALVLYVYENTPASEAGLKRGDMIYKVDGQNITLDNYKSLLGKNSYNLTWKVAVDGIPGQTDKSGSLTKREINEDPIINSQVIEGTNVGYLMYDSFIHGYDDDLKAVFADFKSQGVSDLILDLRYNSGGDDVSATLLASLIAPKASTTGKYFFESVYNDNFEAYYEENPDAAEKNHAKGMKFESHDECLELDRVYILTTDGTASASELVINGLEPVMENVYVVGDTTHGKCTGMSGFPDDEDNPEWGIFPVIVKASNSAGVTDYYNGLNPDVIVDDYPPFYPFGSKEDAFIKTVLDHINGVPFTDPAAAASLKVAKKKFKKIGTVGDKPDICKNLLLLKK